MESLDQVTRNYVTMHPQAAAQTLVRLDDASIRAIFEVMSHPLSARVLEHMAPGSASHCLQLLQPAHGAEIIVQMPILQAVALLRLLEREQVNELLKLMPRARVALLRLRLYHADTAVGAYIDSDVITFNPDQRASDALRLFRRDGQRTGHTIHVVDNRQHVVGLVQLGDLLASPDNALIKNIMNSPASVLHGRVPLQTISNDPAWLIHDSLPVINRNGEFQGVLKRANIIGESRQLLDEVDSRSNADATRGALSEIFWVVIGALFSGGGDSGRQRDEDQER